MNQIDKAISILNAAIEKDFDIGTYLLIGEAYVKKLYNTFDSFFETKK